MRVDRFLWMPLRDVLRRLLLLPTIVASCASYNLVGGGVRDTPPPLASPIYELSECRSLYGGPPVAAAAKLIYFLVARPAPDPGLTLYECAGSGRCAEITNHWVDARGDCFATRVRSGGPGYEYILPHDHAIPAARFEFIGGTFDAHKEGGVMRLDGAPSVQCMLTPYQAPVAAPPATAPAGPGPADSKQCLHEGCGVQGRPDLQEWRMRYALDEAGSPPQRREDGRRLKAPPSRRSRVLAARALAGIAFRGALAGAWSAEPVASLGAGVAVIHACIVIEVAPPGVER